MRPDRRELDGQRRRRRHRRHDRKAGHDRLLHHLEGRAAAHQKHAPDNRHPVRPAVRRRPPCPRRYGGRRPRAPARTDTVGAEEPGRVQPAGLLESAGLPQLPAAPTRPGASARRRIPRPRSRAPSPPTGSSPRSAPTARSAVGRGSTSHDARQVTQIEGDPDSPISRGRLCPKGAASKQLVTHPGRQTKVRYRRPYGTEWEALDLDQAMEMIADRVVEAREQPGRRPPRASRVAPDPRLRQPRRGDAGQRGELPHQEALHGAGRDPDREPGADLTLRHRARSGHLASAAAAPPPSSRIWRTPTASSSRAPTWPSATRSASSG